MAVRHPLRPPAQGRALTPERRARAEALLNHAFARPDLLQQALTHSSAAEGRRRAARSNERLEFLGDRVLGLLIAEWLVERYPAEPEGALGPRLAHLVSREALAAVAGALDIGTLLTVTALDATDNVLADALEALLAALYLDAGLPAARAFVRRAWNDAIERQREPPTDPKTALQQLALARFQALPSYTLLETAGTSHAPTFVIEARVQTMAATGMAGSKKAAEREAAAALLAALQPGAAA